MRVLMGISALVIVATGSLAAQVWREPHLMSHPRLWEALKSPMSQ